MGKEFVSLHASLGSNFDLSEGLKSNSLNITSIKSHGPSGTTTSASSALANLNKLSSSSTKYTIIDIKDDQPEDDQPSVESLNILAKGVMKYSAGWSSSRLSGCTTITTSGSSSPFTIRLNSSNSNARIFFQPPSTGPTWSYSFDGSRDFTFNFGTRFAGDYPFFITVI